MGNVAGDDTGRQTGRTGRRWLRAAGLGLVAAGLIGAMGAGIGVLHLRAGAAPTPEVRPPLTVETVTLTRAASYTVVERVAGRVEAAQETALAFELAGLVTAIAYDEGDRIAAGVTVARLDTALLEDERRRLVATRAALVARLDYARKTVVRRRTLNDKGFTSTDALDEAASSAAALTAEIAAIDAQLKAVETRIAKSQLRAPFGGSVAARHLDPGAVVDPGVPVLTLLSDAAPRVRVGVAPDLARLLTLGDTVTLTHDGRRYTARLIAIRPDIQTLTRTVGLLFELDGADAPHIGTVVELALERTVAADGFWVPRDALAPGQKGLWTVFAIGRDDTVVREAVQVLHVTDDEAYVRGTLADGARIVATGTHRLVPGQRVAAR